MNTQPLTIYQQKLNELRELEASGVKLPMTPEEIVQIEAHGHLVDLETGLIIEDGALVRVTVTELGNLIGRETRG